MCMHVSRAHVYIRLVTLAFFSLHHFKLEVYMLCKKILRRMVRIRTLRLQGLNLETLPKLKVSFNLSCYLTFLVSSLIHRHIATNQSVTHTSMSGICFGSDFPVSGSGSGSAGEGWRLGGGGGVGGGGGGGGVGCIHCGGNPLQWNPSPTGRSL